jgi:hypothetical protein
VRLAHLLEIDLLLELLSELARHRSRAPDPTADLACHTRELFRSQHHQCYDENQQNLREADVEHGARSDVLRRRALRRE